MTNSRPTPPLSAVAFAAQAFHAPRPAAAPEKPATECCRICAKAIARRYHPDERTCSETCSRVILERGERTWGVP